MADYTPPVSTNIPFRFSDITGYSAPNGKELLFRFRAPSGSATIQSAINVMTPYWYETHTYPKTCPKYVVGYGSGRVQILKGRCLYGGIRDIQGLIGGWQSGNLTSSVGAHNPADLQAFLFVKSLIEVSLPAYIHAFQTSVYDLYGYLHGWQELGITAAVGSHIPKNLEANIRPFYRDQVSSFVGLIHGWQTADLSLSFAGTHLPENIGAHVTAKQREQRTLNALIHAWHERFLSASIELNTTYDLSASLLPIPYVNLGAFLKVFPQKSIPASIRGLGFKDLYASISQIFSSNLTSNINGLLIQYKNLRAYIKGSGSENIDIPATITPFHWALLSADVRAKYLGNLAASIRSVTPVSITASIRTYSVSNLIGIIAGEAYPWNLQAIINCVGSWHTLSADILPKQATGIYRLLNAHVHSWESRTLLSYITGTTAHILGADITAIGSASSLHASIYPKMIRLTTVINVSTLSSRNLSAVINYSCAGSGYSNLGASLFNRYKSDIFAYIRPLQYDYKPATLSAKIGYADSYIEVDKFRFSLTVRDSLYFTTDRYKIFLKVFSGGNILSAYIRGTLRYNELVANITGEALAPYVFGSYLKNRETVIHRTYDGMFRYFETVEMAFESIVSDYYYSSDGTYAWKKDRFESWLLDVRSILPEDKVLRLKRRLHRATTVHDLRKFSSVDEAVRYAIDYVTENPQKDLSAYITSYYNFKMLSGTIQPLYIKNDDNDLQASIDPISDTIIVGTASNILKL